MSVWLCMHLLSTSKHYQVIRKEYYLRKLKLFSPVLSKTPSNLFLCYIVKMKHNAVCKNAEEKYVCLYA